MTVNMGTVDRIGRAALGVALLYLAFVSGQPLFAGLAIKLVAAVVGIVMLATATLKMCPIYSLLGIKTCRDC